MSDDLAIYAVTRDPELLSALAARHLPLVKFVARKMSANLPNNIDVDDLVSWGSLGLLDALEKFDPSREVQFSTYAVTRIRGAILDGLQQMEWAPKQVTSKVRSLRKTRQALEQELNREPTDEELAEHMEATPEQVRAWRVDDTTQRIKPLDPPSDSEDDFSINPATDAEQEIAAEVAEIRQRVSMAVRRLPEREQAVFLLYYRDGLTLREIADHLGVSVSSATQTHTRLVEGIRDSLAAFGGTYGARTHQ